MAMESLNRGLAVLQYIAAQGAASVSEIASVFNIHKSTASRILSSLAEYSFLYKDERTLKYYPDVGALLLGSRAMYANRIPDVVHPKLRSLVRSLDFTAQLCLMRHGQVYILDQIKSQSSQYTREPARPGMTEPLHASAIGKCVLAYQPQETIHAFLANAPFPAYTKNTITDPAQLLTELQSIQEVGHAWDKAEFSESVWCLAVPVFQADGRVCMSLALSGDRSLYDNRQIRDKALGELYRTARELQKEYITGISEETGVII